MITKVIDGDDIEYKETAVLNCQQRFTNIYGDNNNIDERLIEIILGKIQESCRIQRQKNIGCNCIK